jgi:hypothetical protein
MIKFQCEMGHIVFANDLTVHKEDWTLEGVKHIRCPFCHKSTIWKYVSEEEK